MITGLELLVLPPGSSEGRGAGGWVSHPWSMISSLLLCNESSVFNGEDRVLKASRVVDTWVWGEQSGWRGHGCPILFLQIVVANGLSCFTACGVFRIRDQTHVSCTGSWTLTTEPPRKPLYLPSWKVIRTFESSQLESLYVRDLLYMILRLLGHETDSSTRCNFWILMWKLSPFSSGMEPLRPLSRSGSASSTPQSFLTAGRTCSHNSGEIWRQNDSGN